MIKNYVKYKILTTRFLKVLKCLNDHMFLLNFDITWLCSVKREFLYAQIVCYGVVAFLSEKNRQGGLIT